MAPNLLNNSADRDVRGDITMRTTTSSEADVEPLVSTTKDGVPYLRRPAVEEQLRWVLLESQSKWICEAKRYFPETLVHLIRKTRFGDPHVHGVLAAELNRRIVRMVRHVLRGRDAVAADDITGRVKILVLRLVFAKTPSRKSEFLEVSFFGAIVDYTRSAKEAYRKTVAGNPGYIFEDAVDDDGDAIERPMELLVSDYASQEECVIRIRRQKQVEVLLAAAVRYVEDPQCLQAVVLHVVEAVPITSDNPEEETIITIFGVTLGQAQHMLKTGMRAFRRAVKELGEIE